MLSLASRPVPYHSHPMGAVNHEQLERMRRAHALKALRRRRGLTQEAAATAHGVTTQAWQNYEAGKRHLSDKKISELLPALDADNDDFEQELQRLPEPSSFAPDEIRMAGPRPLGGLLMAVDGIVHAGALNPNVYQGGEAEIIDFSAFFGPEWRVLRLAGESMIPYAEPGGFVTYSTRRPPRRGQGCVIITTAGEYLVKRFERTAGGKLHVTELYPEERPLAFDLTEIRGVYAIGLRGD